MKSSKTSSRHQIYTFGSLQIQNKNIPVLLKGEKVRKLLGYLVLRPDILHRREMLADLLWPDAVPDRVRRNLTDVLYRLQRDFSFEWLKIDADSIALQSDENLWADVWEFDHLIASKDNDSLQKAVEIYTGDLFSEIYDEWMIPERELRRSQYLSALETLSEQCNADGKLQEALLYIRKLILTEPLHEPAHQSYLRLLGRLRRFSEAISHYDYLCELLHSELDSRPMAMTDLIFQSLLRERDLENTSILIEESRPFIGRKDERVIAFSSVEAMLNKNGGILIVEGEAGIGKSRLLREIASGARWRGAAVLQGQVGETPGASPFQPLIEAFSPLINGPQGKKLETLLAGEILAALIPLVPAWKTKASSLKTSAEQDRKRFYNALNLFGETIAKLMPVTLVLDDLHWATPALWECLSSFASGFIQHGGLLVLAYRRPEIEKNPGWDVIKNWDLAGLLKTIPLEALNVDEVAQFIGELKNIDPVKMHEWTSGNPFFINQWLAEPELKQWTRDRVIFDRLNILSAAARSVLESASILGENIPYRIWAEVAGLSPLTLATFSDELTVHHWLERSTTGYVFSHNLIHSAVYDSIELGQRRKLHQRAALALSILDSENLHARAFHFERAELLTEAARAYRLAGEQDLTRFAFREAQNSLDRALTLTTGDTTIERIEIALALIKVCDATGDRLRQKSALDEVLASTSDHDTYRLQALLEYVQFATHTGKVAEAEQHLKSALMLAQDLHDTTRETEAIILFGNLAAEQGKWDEAHRWGQQAFEQTRATGNRSAEGRALRFMGIVTKSVGHPEESIQWFEKALAIHHELGDRYQSSVTLTNLLGALNDLGAWDRLITTAQEVVSIREELGDRVGASNTRHNQSLAYYALGDYATARQILERVIKDSEAAQIRRRMGLARNVLGLVYEGEGDYEQALHLYNMSLADAEATEAVMEGTYVKHDLGALLVRLNRPLEAIPLLEAARAVWVDLGNLQLQVKTEAFLGLACLAAGQRSRAEELAENGWNSFQSGVPVGEQTQDWLWTLHRLLMELDQSEAAGIILRAAYAELQRQAQNISNLDLRRSFFERVQINHNIVTAYDQISSPSRIIPTSLARKNVPLGRSLREEDFVTIQWTLNAPEDEAISDKSARRHQRLKRLLKEAELQGASPTDDDLARALGVSRRTILRDIQALAREIPRPSTRKRK